jgi:periplasmic protein TonB
MFEDSTFETNGRIRTRSRNWMLAAFAFNSSILLALIVFPIIFPQALPHQMITYLMEAPMPPHAQQQPQQPAHAAQAVADTQESLFLAPRIIPISISTENEPEGLPNVLIPGHDLAEGVPGGDPGPAFPGNTVHPIVHQEHIGPMAVPSSVVSGLLLQKVVPQYPRFAIATRTEGTVTLAAIISKTGTIENLRVVSGPPMLRQAALDAVKYWRYQPYLLDGQPVEVETTVNVVFSLAG